MSFAHGSNDGQKGMGLIVLILVGIVPATFSLDMNTTPQTIAHIHADATGVRAAMAARPAPPVPDTDLVAARKVLTGYLRKDPVSPATILPRWAR